ncbi:MAG: PAS domain-containing protein [Acetobacteraceae bacterium]|nr:PAS domain-containing protein [Acetobacteraceae bacterium]
MRALSQIPNSAAGEPVPAGILHRSTVWLLAAAIALPLAILGVGGWLSWNAAWRNAAAELQHTADAGAEYGMRTLTGYSIAADRLNDLVRGMSDAEIRARERELHDAMRALIAELPQAEAGAIVDRQGSLLVATTPFPVPRQPLLAGRDYFTVLKQDPNQSLYVGRILHSQISGRSFFAVSRHRTGSGNGLPPGAFDGIVSILVFPERLAEGMSRLLSDPGDMLELIREDGQFLALTGGGAVPPPLPADGPFRKAVAAGEQEAIYTAPSAQDGSPQLIAMQQLERLPIYVSVTRPRATILARSWEAFLPQLAIGLPAMLALAGLALLIRRGQRQLLAANASLEARVRDRTAALAELSDALDLVPTSVADLDGVIRYWSSGCERLYGYSRAEMLGQSAARMLRSEFPPGGRQAALETLWRDGEWRGELWQRRRDGSRMIADCRWILRRDPVSGQPVSIVSSRTDMTALRQTERALIESEARLRRAQEASGVVAFTVGPEGLSKAGNALLGLLGLPPGVHLDLASLLDRVHPDDREALLAGYRRTAREGGSFAQEFRVIWPDGTHHWLLARGEAEANPEGGERPRGITGVMLDITARKAAETAQAESEERLRLAQEAAGIGTYDFDFQTGRIAWDARMRAIWGVPEGQTVTLRLFIERIHPQDRRRRWDAMKRAMDPQGPRRYQVEYRLAGRQDGMERWVVVTGQVRFAGDRPVRLVGTVLDITERKQAEQRSTLLMREVDHRAKNALAVVQAALRLTRAESPAEFVRSVEGRIAALARAQTMLARQRWEGAELRTLLEGELAPFLNETAQGGPRAKLSGPPVMVPARATQPLGMALHELATNALKYGALSAPGGMLTVSWRLDAAERLLHLTWQESGGPRLASPPDRRGFGSRVIEQTVQSQLGGRVNQHWLEDGLICEMTVPLGRHARLAGEARGDGGKDNVAAA